MSEEQYVSVMLLLGLLGIAMVSDLRRHRIPNTLVVVGLICGVASQVYALGVFGAGYWLVGALIGFSIFIPMYALGGMAAGDVKLMAMAASFLAPRDALNAALFSLLAGGLCGVLIVVVRGQLFQMAGRYWLILKARAYFPPAADEVA